jgi:hypothetical protein
MVRSTTQRKAQAGAVRLSSFCDRRPDAALPQDPAVLVVVVAAVGEQHVGPTPWPTPATAGILSSRGRSWVTSLRLPPVSDTPSGMP